MAILSYIPDSEYEDWQRRRRAKRRTPEPLGRRGGEDEERISLWRAAQAAQAGSSGVGFPPSPAPEPGLTPGAEYVPFRQEPQEQQGPGFDTSSDLIPGVSGAVGPYATMPPQEPQGIPPLAAAEIRRQEERLMGGPRLFETPEQGAEELRRQMAPVGQALEWYERELRQPQSEAVFGAALRGETMAQPLSMEGVAESIGRGSFRLAQDVAREGWAEAARRAREREEATPEPFLGFKGALGMAVPTEVALNLLLEPAIIARGAAKAAQLAPKIGQVAREAVPAVSRAVEAARPVVSELARGEAGMVGKVPKRETGFPPAKEAPAVAPGLEAAAAAPILPERILQTPSGEPVARLRLLRGEGRGFGTYEVLEWLGGGQETVPHIGQTFREYFQGRVAPRLLYTKTGQVSREGAPLGYLQLAAADEKYLAPIRKEAPAVAPVDVAALRAEKLGIKGEMAALQEKAPNPREFRTNEEFQVASSKWAAEMQRLSDSYQEAGGAEIRAREVAQPTEAVPSGEEVAKPAAPEAVAAAPTLEVKPTQFSTTITGGTPEAKAELMQRMADTETKRTAGQAAIDYAKQKTEEAMASGVTDLDELMEINRRAVTDHLVGNVSPAVVKPALTPPKAYVEPEWLRDIVDANYRRAERLGIVEQIEEMAAQKLTAKQIAIRLGLKDDRGALDTELVYSVRKKLNIPSMEERPEFEAWLKERQVQPPELKPPLTVPEPKEKPPLPEEGPPVSGEPAVAAPEADITPLLDRYNAVQDRLAQIGDEIGTAETETAMFREGMGVIRPPADHANPAIRKLSTLTDEQLVEFAKQERADPFREEWFESIDSKAVDELMQDRGRFVGREAREAESSASLKALWDEERNLRLESRDLERRMERMMGEEGPVTPAGLPEAPEPPLAGEAGGIGKVPPTAEGMPPTPPPKRPRKPGPAEPPPPVPPREGERIARIAPTETIEAWIQKQSRLKPLVDLAAPVPGVKGAVSKIDPALAQQSHLERIPLVFSAMEDQANNIVRGAMLQMEAALPGGFEIKAGRFVKGVKPKAEYANASLAWGDVAEHPYRYEMPERLRNFFTTAHEIIDDFGAWGEAEGIKVHKIKFEEGGHYFGRLVREVREAALQARANPLAPRAYDEMAEGLQRGVVYEDDMLATLNAIFNWYGRRIVAKRSGEIVQPLGRTAKQLVDPKLTEALEQNIKQLRTVNAYERTLKGIRDGMSIYYEVDMPGAKAGTKVRTQLTAMDKVQPGTLNRLVQADEAGYAARQSAVADLLKELEPIKKGAGAAYQGAKAKRARAIELVKTSPEMAVEGAKFGIEKPAITVSRIKEGFAGGRLFPKETADYLNRAFSNERNATLKGLNTFGSAMQSIKAGWDFGVVTLHLLPVAGSHPRVFAGAARHMYLSALRPETHAAYMARPDTVAILRELLPHGLSIEGPEYVTALERGGGLERAAGLIGRAGEPGKAAAEAIQQQVLKRGEMSFTAPLNYAKIELAKALLPTFRKQGKLRDLAIFLNDVTGTRSSLEMGLGSGQRAAERLAFFSPRFLRSSLALVGDALEPSATSIKANEARKALASIAGAMVFIPLGIRLASGQPIDEDFFDPSSGNFLSARIFDQDVGIGGVYRSLVNLVANSYKTAQKDPGKFLDVRDRRENPLTRWWTSRTSIPLSMMFDIGEQREFLGRKLETPEQWARWGARAVTPFWAQEFITEPGEPAPGPATLLTELHGFRAAQLTPAERRDVATAEAAKAQGKVPEDIGFVKMEKLRRTNPEVFRLSKEAIRQYAERGSVYHNYKLKLDEEADRLTEAMAATKAQLDAGAISGSDYRRNIQLLERDMAQRHDNLIRQNPAFGKVLAEIEQERAKEEAKMPLEDRFVTEYYAITQELLDPGTGMLTDVPELLRRREEMKTKYPPEVVSEGMEYVNRRRDPQYVQALADYAEYRKIEPKMTGMTPEELRIAERFLKLKRDIAQSLPPFESRSKYAEGMAIEKDPKGYALYRQRVYIEKLAGKWITLAKQDFWAKHPLLQKFFSRTPVQMPVKKAS